MASTVTLVAGGDICPGDHYFTLGHGTGTRLARGHDPFEPIRRILSQADIALANLEGPLASVSVHVSPAESRVFRGPPEAAGVFRAAGWDMLHIANNHILQHGEAAFHETIRALRRGQVEVVGLAAGEASGQCLPVIRHVEGLSVGFLGYSFVTERNLRGQELYAAPDVAGALLDIEFLRDRVDVVVVSAHWGEEARSLPDRFTVDAAARMVDAGAKVIVGHHPHVLQPIVRVGGALVAYSLGDLLFDLFWDRRLVEGALLRVELDENGLVGHELIPTRLGRDYRIWLESGDRGGRSRGGTTRNQMPVDRTIDQSLGPAQLLDQSRKALFFLRNVWRGDVSAKLGFIRRKAWGALGLGARPTRSAESAGNGNSE